jgi:hypothetical protein
MATPPDFSVGQVLTAANMNAVGLWLVKSQAVGTGVSSVTVTGAFSADYENYKVVYSGGVASTNITTTLQLGASTADYNLSLPYVVYGSGTPSGTSVSAGTNFALVGYGTTDYININIDVCDPFTTRWTRVMGHYIGTSESGYYGGIHKVASSFSSFTIGSVFGTMTGGTIRVYGYRN